MTHVCGPACRAGVAEGRDAASLAAAEEPRELQARHAVEQETASYKAAVSKLRGLKGEIEHLQLLLEQGKRRLQQDFQQWLSMVASQQQQQQHVQEQEPSAQGVGGGGSRPSTAGRYGQSANSSSMALRDAQAAAVSSRPGTANSRDGAVLARPVGSAAAQPASGFDVAGVLPRLLQAAAPHLTGNAEADADIVRFYEARDKLLQLKLRAGGGGGA